VKKSILWLPLVTAALALSGCGGSEAPADKPAATKKGKEQVNPWAKDPPPGSVPAEAPKKKKKAGKAKAEPTENPWAKDPPPGSEPTGAAKKKK
jgi:hypothetical protein